MSDLDHLIDTYLTAYGAPNPQVAIARGRAGPESSRPTRGSSRCPRRMRRGRRKLEQVVAFFAQRSTIAWPTPTRPTTYMVENPVRTLG